MAFESKKPIQQVILYDSNGNKMAVEDGVAVPAGTPGVLLSGRDTDGNANPVEMAPGGGIAIAARRALSSLPSVEDAIPDRAFPLAMDSAGLLRTRGQVLTDEGTFKDRFDAPLESNLTGTVTFTSGSDVVTGVGTAFTTEARVDGNLRLSTDGQSDYVPIEIIRSDTVVILERPYGGSSGSGTATFANWVQVLSGGTASVASSVVEVEPGTASGNHAAVLHEMDFLPLVGEFRCRMSQRIADQEAVVGFVDTYPSPTAQAVVVFDGTDDGQVKFRTSTSSDQQETVIDLSDVQAGLTTAVDAIYKIELLAAKTTLLVNDVVLAEHTLGVPDPYQTLDAVLGIENTAVVGSTTELICGLVLIENTNVLNVGTIVGEVRTRQGSPGHITNPWYVEARGPDADGAAPTQPPVLAAGQDGTNVQTLKTDAAGRLEQVLYDSAGNPVTVLDDAGTHRLQIQGKVTVVGAAPPPATTPAEINADNPLTVGSHDTSFTIPNGETFFLQGLIAGNEDPTKGASIEILYDNGSEHLIARTYLAGFTISIGYSDVSKARDGTVLAGNGSNTIIVRRTKFSGTNIAIDAVVTGYTV